MNGSTTTKNAEFNITTHLTEHSLKNYTENKACRKPKVSYSIRYTKRCVLTVQVEGMHDCWHINHFPCSLQHKIAISQITCAVLRLLLQQKN